MWQSNCNLGKPLGTISAVQMDFVQIAFQPPPSPLKQPDPLGLLFSPKISHFFKTAILTMGFPNLPQKGSRAQLTSFPVPPFQRCIYDKESIFVFFEVYICYKIVTKYHGSYVSHVIPLLNFHIFVSPNISFLLNWQHTSQKFQNSI